MRADRVIELTVGLFMLASLAALAILAFRVSNLSDHMTSDGYTLTAHFDNVGDLKPRASVKVAGVKIGRVTRIRLDAKSYKAIVTLWIDHRDTALPSDTAASIYTAGLLGANYISLVPGFEEDRLADGGRIDTTHPALVLENLIGHLLFKTESAN